MMTPVQVLWEGKWRDGFRKRRGPDNSRVIFFDDDNEIEINTKWPNDKVRIVGDQAPAFQTCRIIPRTPLRRFYTLLRSLRGGSIAQFETLESLLNPVNGLGQVEFIAELFKRSVDQFSVYDNRGEPFIRDPNAREQNPQRTGCAQQLLDEWRKVGELFPKLRYVDYELNPYRTTKSCFDDGESGDSSGQGGMDLLLCASDSDTKRPVVGEIKAATESVGPTFALIQALTYASELVTDTQIERIRKHYNEPFNRCDKRAEICLILEEPTTCARGDDDCAHALAEGLLKCEDVSKYIARIRCLGCIWDDEGDVEPHERW